VPVGGALQGTESVRGVEVGGGGRERDREDAGVGEQLPGAAVALERGERAEPASWKQGRDADAPGIGSGHRHAAAPRNQPRKVAAPERPLVDGHDEHVGRGARHTRKSGAQRG
jgi:hypothetical protein